MCATSLILSFSLPFSLQIGERFFEIHAQNLHDSRNVKILKIHAITNKEHHR